MKRRQRYPVAGAGRATARIDTVARECVASLVYAVAAGADDQRQHSDPHRAKIHIRHTVHMEWHRSARPVTHTPCAGGVRCQSENSSASARQRPEPILREHQRRQAARLSEVVTGDQRR